MLPFSFDGDGTTSKYYRIFDLLPIHVSDLIVEAHLCPLVNSSWGVPYVESSRLTPGNSNEAWTVLCDKLGTLQVRISNQEVGTGSKDL